MMARSSKAPSIGRIQKRKTNLLQIIIFDLQRAAGPYRWAKLRHMQCSKSTSCLDRRKILCEAAASEKFQRQANAFLRLFDL